MKKTIVILTFLFVFSLSNNANEREIVLGQGHYGNGHDQIYIEPPYVTYDDDLNELYVYFGTTGTIDLEYIYGESNYGGYTATYTNLPVGYYTITIHSVYGYTYYGNFTVS